MRPSYTPQQTYQYNRLVQLFAAIASRKLEYAPPLIHVSDRYNLDMEGSIADVIQQCSKKWILDAPRVDAQSTVKIVVNGRIFHQPKPVQRHSNLLAWLMVGAFIANILIWIYRH
jgi:hypothetical protein